MDIKETYAIYPIYIDSSRTQKEGRKYHIKYCLPNPTHSEITSALKSLEIPFIDNPTKRHPREPFVFGRVHVNKKFEKYFVLSGIKSVIEENRQSKKVCEEMDLSKNKQINESQNIKKGYIKNDLNLVPRKKNKKKK